VFWRAMIRHKRSVLAFSAWAVVTMTAVSIAYGLAYLGQVPLSAEAMVIWLVITVGYGFAMAAGLIVANGALWAAVLVARRFGRGANSPGVLLQTIACCAGADIGMFLGESLKWGLLGEKPRFSPLLPILVNAWWIGAGFLFLRLAVQYAARYRRIKQATQIAEGQVLANQLKPHFLFNSLHALSELIETDARQGAEMAQRLSELFRRISDGSRHATTPIANELAIVREYLEIEAVRLGSRLRWAVDEPPWSRECHVPTLMIQTLVENAIKHGIAPAIEGGDLRVSFRELDDGMYECAVVNTGAPLEQRSAAKGVGLANTRERLRQLYGDRGTLDLTAGGNATCARFVFSGEALAQNIGR
jgi:hypothetical protein